MFKIESYVTPILLSYVDKYVRDFKPADAQVSLWGGGVALHNLVLKADVLQQEVALPFTLVSGRIHELLIQVPWTKIMSEPIVVTIDTIECVLSLNPPVSSEDSMPVESPSRKTQVVEAPPGYMQALVRRIVSNIALRVHHLIVKYVQDDVVMSLNVKHLAVDSAGPNWEPAFADIDLNQPMVRRLVRLDDLTLCLDKSDSDGKIRFFQEPLLYRCQLDLRVLTRLVSANTRRATSLNVQLRSVKLAWSVSNEQLLLLLRLLRERPATKPQTPAPKQSASQTPLHTTSANSAEPARSESWSEWAWSWLPTWMDREAGVEEAPVPPTPLPLFFSAYLDDVSLVFKVMEVEGSNRKRSRSVLELGAGFAALKASICSPTSVRVRFGTRTLELRSQGKCVCGHVNLNTANDEPTIYLQKTLTAETETQWAWPEGDLNEKVETGEAVDETFHATADHAGVPEEEPSPSEVDNRAETETPAERPEQSERDDADELWAKMEPLLYVEYVHERAPPNQYTNPYDNPPKDFEYSDWVEECTMSVKLEPVETRICMGLIHRLLVLRLIYRDKPVVQPEPQMRTLTVEECESLSENLPQRRINVEVRGFCVRVIPWSHIPTAKSHPPSVVLEIEMPKTTVNVIAPLYPHRVCSAACQLPEGAGALWRAARRHVSVRAAGLQLRLADARPVARAQLQLVLRQLLHPNYFTSAAAVRLSYHLKIKELNICGSSARLQAAYHVPMSLYHERRSMQLKHTSLPKDAISDEEAVAIDFTMEDLAMRGYMTSNINTHVIALHSAKCTAFHSPKGGEVKQAWLFSAPDCHTTTPFLRIAVQWCKEAVPDSFDYLGMWTEPFAMSIDPLLIAWLAYKPTLKPNTTSSTSLKSMSSSQLLLRRRSTPPSSGRGSRVAGAELVHMRARSHGSSSEPSDKRDSRPSVPQLPMQPKPPESWISGEWLVAIHKRLREMLVNVEMGLVLVYVTMSTASAVDCATLRDAMERHAAGAHRVLAISLGRLSVHSSAATKQLWQELRHDGPTFVKEKPNTESFPWKLCLADVSCYTLEVRTATTSAEVVGQEKLKSNLRVPRVATPRTVLELVTTSITVSVVTKSIQYKTISRKEMKMPAAASAEQGRTKYFTSGLEFKPTTLKEFVRGPSERKRKTSIDPSATADPSADAESEMVTIKDGPVVSLGVHLHADTPPLVIRLERDQIHIVAAAVHCFTHIHTLLKQAPVSNRPTLPKFEESHKSLIQSVSEMEEIPTASDTSENRSELISIFDRAIKERKALKTFFWFQWVVSRATLVVASDTVKLALDIDDVISTVDIQAQYNQFKIKLASASIRHYERGSTDEWTAGVLGGRVLEAREPINDKEDTRFLAITITQAQVSTLPASWKEELHPKLLEQNSSEDNMWEVYAALAPLEAIIQPAIMDNVMSLVKEMLPRAFCPLKAYEVVHRRSTWQWPFCYLTAGGIRVLLTGEEQSKKDNLDDTFILSIGIVNINPHPDNPICRRAVNPGTDGGWLAASGGFDGRQYEILVSDVSAHSGKFKQLVLAEGSDEYKKGTASENPALKWSQVVEPPVLMPILHTVDLCCVLAPALFAGGALAAGAAVELNLVSDCSIELSVAQLALIKHMLAEFTVAAHRDSDCADTSLVGFEYFDKHGWCPYATLIMKHEADMFTEDDITVYEAAVDNKMMYTADLGRSTTCDSGVDTGSSKTKMSEDTPLKKVVSIACVEQLEEASQYLEVFVTMGVIDLSLYVADDGSPEVAALRPPRVIPSDQNPPDTYTQDQSDEQPADADKRPDDKAKKEKDSMMQTQSETVNELVRETDGGKTMLDMTNTQPARKIVGNVPLLHVTLFQPNVYYWKRKALKTLQLSLFNAWAALGVGDIPGHWHSVLMATARGVNDPVTDIPPALATLKVVAPVSSSMSSMNASAGGRGTIRLDVEKPVQFDVSTDKLIRLLGIISLVKTRVQADSSDMTSNAPLLYKLRNYLVRKTIESITIQTSQLSVCGAEGTVGWDSASLQLAASGRAERLVARGLVSAAMLATGTPHDRRRLFLQPLMLGIELEATWEAWRRAESGLSAFEPTVKINLELDDITVDLRPVDLAAFQRLRNAIEKFLKRRERLAPAREHSTDSVLNENYVYSPRASLLHFQRGSVTSDSDSEDHFYKDDLRSGAFKILSGGQLPMAYQVMLSNNAVSWRYPHPRAITRLVAFPLPGLDKEIECVLEFYADMLGRWEPHTYFKIPVGEPRELQLYVPPPDCVFAIMWRFRTCTDPEQTPLPYEFNMERFTPKSDPLTTEQAEAAGGGGGAEGAVSAEQLSGALRVDSYFAPRLMPRTRLLVRAARIDLHAHNSLPQLPNEAMYLEGYYVSKPLMRTHRVLSLIARNTSVHAHCGSPAGALYVFDTKLSCDMVECSTGTMEELVGGWRVAGGVSAGARGARGRALRGRAAAAALHAALHMPRLRTLHALATDWQRAYQQYIVELKDSGTYEEDTETRPTVEDVHHKHEVVAVAAAVLEGRVALWVHNSSTAAMRIGQEGTDEVLPMGPGARLAYRWRSPTAPKKLRLALAGPTADWHWSVSLPFLATVTRVRLETDSGNAKHFPNTGTFMHVKVEDFGASRYMHLSGRLVLANMLKMPLLYKVRSHGLESSQAQWRTVCSGEMAAESVGRSVVCSAECEMVLKIKFRTHSTGWSGDIPLKECPKENVPWLVKVPSDGDTPGQFVSVWCRVVRARSDGRILATVWPLYVLHSHLPLDTDVLIVTESTTTTGEDLTPLQVRPPPLLQSAPGRGTSTQLQPPGTTAARHSLSFQYRNIECPVTREAVPLHYGVTDVSVFDKRAPVASIDDVVKEIKRWLARSGRNEKSSWPYSLVAKHWDGGEWMPASLQPRCDVTVRYQAVRAGGGCCLEIQLCPVALLCNSTPISLTLRAYDAAPLCKLESGTAISPPSAILEKPFFMSVEMGRETFVSNQLQVSTEEPGRYGSPPPGHVALDHAAHFAILCNQKVALLTLYYEIKEQINVLGVSSTYMLINRLDTDLMVSAIVVPNDVEEESSLRPKTFKMVPPTKEGSVHGTALCRFWLRGRWRGGDPSGLRAYLCLSLPASSYPARAPVPIRLGHPPVRRAMALVDVDFVSVPVVVTQMKQDSRWVIVVARDPCPQFMVHNQTRTNVAVAQPLHSPDEPSTSHVEPASECAGVRWVCMVAPMSAIHYSTPAHCARYPPSAPTPLAAPTTVPFLTFAKGRDEAELEWCMPVVVADGEHLLQYCGGITIKLRVRTHPHSTQLELQDVDHNDISASDIRRRLYGAFASTDETQARHLRLSEANLERIDANSRLFRDEEEMTCDQTSGVSDQWPQTPQPQTPRVDNDDSNVMAAGTSHQDHARKKSNASTVVLFLDSKKKRGSEPNMTARSDMIHQANNIVYSQTTFEINDIDSDLSQGESSCLESERFRFVVESVAIELAASPDVMPLVALHLDRSALLVLADDKKIRTVLTIADAQIDNLQYDSGQFDFAVVASTRAQALASERAPPPWNMFASADEFALRVQRARLLLQLLHDRWQVGSDHYTELTEVELKLGRLALFVEDAYVSALAALARQLTRRSGSGGGSGPCHEETALARPLRLRMLHVHPLDLTLTLHTAVRMYIALDQSPLRLSAFKLNDMTTSAERLTHALTVHYLSAAILGAGWVVGGLELLGAPGALAARLGGATGGVRGVASAAAAALLRSLSAWAGSLARNLDLLAGDEEHARRAAAARRRPPTSFVAGLIAGITNFAINILGAVGGLAHHPLVGVAVGESESGATALRRGLLGALTKPLSATADLVAYAGSGLLRQTGWDPVPQPRRSWSGIAARTQAGWQRDCVRWMFRLCELTALSGFEVLLDNAPLQLLLTHKFLVVADPETERIVEMIDLRFCSLGPYQGQIIELCVTQRRQSKMTETRIVDEDDEYQISAAAMARVARYTGTEGGAPAEMRVLSLLPAPGRSFALHCALAAALHHNADSHFPLL